MGLIDRIKRLMRTRDYYASLVRPYEEETRDYNTKYALGDLVKRYSKYVKVASLRNAQAVAALKLRVCREERRSANKVMRTKSLAPSEVRRLCRTGWTAKSLDTESEYEEITDTAHPIVRLFTKVNPEWNGYELIEATQLMMGLTGNFFWFDSPGPDGMPGELWPMWPQFMDIKPSREGLVDKYIWGRGTESMKEYEPEQITAFRNPNPFGNPWWGVGDLYACIIESDLSQSFSQAAITMVDRGAQPGLIVNVPGWNEHERRQFEMALNRKADGGRNAGRSLVTSLPKDTLFERWEMSTKEAGMFAGTSEQRARDIIAACFDMPVGLLNMEEKSLANGKVVIPHWQMLAIAPRAKRIEDKINDSHFMDKFRKKLGDPTLFVAFDNPVQEDETSNADFVAKLFPIGVMKLDEARTKVGLEPVGGEEGNSFYQPVGPTDPNPQDDTDDDIVAEKPDRDDAKSVTVVVNVPDLRSAQAVAPTTAAVARAFSKCCEHHHESAIKSLLDRKTVPPQEEDGPPRPLIVTLAAELASAYLRATPSIVAGVLNNPTTALSVITDIVEDSGLPTMLVSDVATAARPIFVDGAQRAFEGIVIPSPGIVGSFDITNEFAREAYQGYTVRLSQSVTDTTARALSTAIEEGVARGADLSQLTADVQTVMDDLSGYAAERIARTEASRAYTAGRITQWKASGVVVARTWRKSGNPCPMCEAAAEQFKSVPLDQPMVPRGGVFKWTDRDGKQKSTTMDYASVEGGDIHPNCVLGDTKVSLGSYLAAIRANYSGPVIEVRTASGRVLTVTENHQLLTDSGFVAAKFLQNGDNLVGGLRAEWTGDAVDPDDETVPPLAKDVFDSSAMTGLMSPRSVPLSPEYLHGDAVRVNGEIDVVASDCLLRSGGNPHILEHLCKHDLGVRYAESHSRPSSSNLDAMLLALRLAAESGMGGSGDGSPLSGRSLPGNKKTGGGTSARLETSLSKSGGDDCARNAESISYCLDRLSGVVGLDQIVSIDVRQFAGHVYDFSTVSGAYMCNGIVGHNCRCTIEAVFIPEVA